MSGNEKVFATAPMSPEASRERIVRIKERRRAKEWKERGRTGEGRLPRKDRDA
jgi:hypothetical protein